MQPQSPLIVVIDDDESTNKILRLLLEQEGYRTVGGHSRLEATTLIWATPPDLVMLDIQMGDDDDGWHVLEQLRHDPTTQRIPVIVCSGYRDFLHDHREQLHEYGCYVLQKGFKVSELLAAVRAALE